MEISSRRVVTPHTIHPLATYTASCAGFSGSSGLSGLFSLPLCLFAFNSQIAYDEVAQKEYLLCDYNRDGDSYR
jgi:hypothetical protein